MFNVLMLFTSQHDNLSVASLQGSNSACSYVQVPTSSIHVRVLTQPEMSAMARLIMKTMILQKKFQYYF